MKFAHLADTHLGFRQYGLQEREKDLYEVFDKIIDKIIEEKVDFVIHSGDLFQSAKPSPNALLSFQKCLLRLKGNGIPVYAIAGNHDALLSKNAIPPQVLFKKLGLKLISPINTSYVFDGVFIGGLPFFPSSQIKSMKNKLAELSKKAEEYDKSILVLHQGIDKYLNVNYELEIGDIPDNFDYYAFGHIHNYIEDDFGDGKLVYPGSMDILRSSEYSDYVKNGKGIVIVDLDGDKPAIKRIPISIPREFINRTIDFNNLENDLNAIKVAADEFDSKPIINLTVLNVDRNVKDIHDLISSKLSDSALIIRPVFKFSDDEEIESFSVSGRLGPRELLVDKLNEFGNENIVKLGVDLYNTLHITHTEEADEVARSYFENNFDSIVVDKKDDESDDGEDVEESEEDSNSKKDSNVITFKGAL